MLGIGFAMLIIDPSVSNLPLFFFVAFLILSVFGSLPAHLHEQCFGMLLYGLRSDMSSSFLHVKHNGMLFMFATMAAILALKLGY